MPVKTGVASVPPNPSVILLHDDSGIGMIAHDDVFRIHHRALFDGKTMKLRDDSLVGVNTPTVKRAFANYDLTFLVHAAAENEMSVIDNWLEQMGITTQSLMSAKQGRR